MSQGVHPAQVVFAGCIALRGSEAIPLNLIDLDRNVVRARLEMMRTRLVNPPIGKAEYIASLERLSLPEAAASLRELLPEG